MTYDYDDPERYDPDDAREAWLQDRYWNHCVHGEHTPWPDDYKPGMCCVCHRPLNSGALAPLPALDLETSKAVGF